MDFWSVVAAAAVANTLVLGLVGFLGKSLIEQWLQKEMVKFGKIHERRLTLYETLNDQMNTMFHSVFELALYSEYCKYRETAPNEAEWKAQWNLVNEKWSTFNEQLHTSQIFLPPGVYHKLLTFCNLTLGFIHTLKFNKVYSQSEWIKFSGPFQQVRIALIATINEGTD